MPLPWGSHAPTALFDGILDVRPVRSQIVGPRGQCSEFGHEALIQGSGTVLHFPGRFVFTGRLGRLGLGQAQLPNDQVCMTLIRLVLPALWGAPNNPVQYSGFSQFSEVMPWTTDLVIDREYCGKLFPKSADIFAPRLLWNRPRGPWPLPPVCGLK